MGLIDISILTVLGLFIIKGLLRGLLKEICSLLGLVLGGVFAFTFNVPLAQLLQDSFNLPASLCVWGAFLAIFLLVVLVFAVIGFVLHRFVKLIFLGGFNRIAGAFFGVIQSVVILAFILLALNSTAAPQSVRLKMDKSQLAPPFVVLGETIFSSAGRLVGR